MWWLFEKVEENAFTVLYRYARESCDCDGRIAFDKGKGIVLSFRHCSGDQSEFDKTTAIDKFVCFVADEGYPDRRRVVCG